MKTSTTYMTSVVMMMATLALLSAPVFAAPMESEDEQIDNSLVHPDNEGMPASWDAIDTATIRKLLLQLDAEERMNRVSRAWPGAEPRGWGLRAMDGRLARQWRADKRQVRFRQCYFNPISCFRK